MSPLFRLEETADKVQIQRLLALENHELVFPLDASVLHIQTEEMRVGKLRLYHINLPREVQFNRAVEIVLHILFFRQQAFANAKGQVGADDIGPDRPTGRLPPVQPARRDGADVQGEQLLDNRGEGGGILRTENQVFAAWPQEDVEQYLALTRRFQEALAQKAREIKEES